MPTSRAVATELDNILNYLLDARLALYRTSLSFSPTSLGWHGFGQLHTEHGEATSLREYLDWVSTSQYNVVLFDGALLQLSYEFDGAVVIGHRLAYVPTPFILDPSVLETEPLADTVRYAALEDGTDNIQLRSAIRFDFDPQSARPGHPTVHLTINSNDCRIACHSPMRTGSFIRFVFENFYASEWRRHDYLRDLPVGSWGGRTLTADEAAHPHVAWSR